MEQAEKSQAEIALKLACRGMAKMEAGIFGMPINPGRADQLFQAYMLEASQPRALK